MHSQVKYTICMRWQVAVSCFPTPCYIWRILNKDSGLSTKTCWEKAAQRNTIVPHQIAILCSIILASPTLTVCLIHSQPSLSYLLWLCHYSNPSLCKIFTTRVSQTGHSQYHRVFILHNSHALSFKSIRGTSLSRGSLGLEIESCLPKGRSSSP